MKIVLFNTDKHSMQLTIEDLLQRVQRGDVEYVSIVAVTKDEQVLSALSGLAEATQPFTMIGALEVMHTGDQRGDDRMKMVPDFPTDVMMRAAMQCVLYGDLGANESMVKNIYKTMLAAAPSPWIKA